MQVKVTVGLAPETRAELARLTSAISALRPAANINLLSAALGLGLALGALAVWLALEGGQRGGEVR